MTDCPDRAYDEYRQRCVDDGICHLCEGEGCPLCYGELKQEAERLRRIIAKWYEYWPEPWGEGRDGFEMQEFGEKHGILICEERTTPCAENCNCSEFFGNNETVDCYRLAPEFIFEGE